MRLVTMGSGMLVLYHRILCNDKDWYVGIGRTANLQLYGRWTEQTYVLSRCQHTPTRLRTSCHDPEIYNVTS